MTFKSKLVEIGPVPFPEHTGERIYMRRFTRSAGLPPDLRRWWPTVEAMLRGIETDDPAYLMVDQGTVQAGRPHRRPGVHLDGYWVESARRHGGGHRGTAGSWDSDNPGWKTARFEQPEAIILASDVVGCQAYLGEWDGHCGDMGDCSHVDVSDMVPVQLRAGLAYAGNVTMLHESIPQPAEVRRTLVRLSVPGWTP